MTTKQVKLALEGVADTLGKNKAGNYIARRGFFYRHGGSAENLAKHIQLALPAAHIVATGEKYCAFRGGASTANQSHWWVEFNFPVSTAPIATV